MRPLTISEIEAVSGAETITYTLPAGSTVNTRLEANQSTTITVNIPGFSQMNWNSGTAVACFIITTGFVMTATALSANPWVGALTGMLVSQGCSMLADSIQSQSNPGDDGD